MRSVLASTVDFDTEGLLNSVNHAGGVDGSSLLNIVDSLRLFIALLSELLLSELGVHAGVGHGERAGVVHKLGVLDLLVFIVLINSEVVVSDGRGLALTSHLGLGLSKHSLVFLDYSRTHSHLLVSTGSSVLGLSRLLDGSGHKFVSFLASILVLGLLGLALLDGGLLLALNLTPAVVVRLFYHVGKFKN